MKPKENVSFRLKNIMPGPKKLWEEHLFPLEKLFFLPSVEKSNHFSSGNKSSPQSFSVPGIMFPARRNIYSPAHFTAKRRRLTDICTSSLTFNLMLKSCATVISKIFWEWGQIENTLPDLAAFTIKYSKICYVCIILLNCIFQLSTVRAPL